MNTINTNWNALPPKFRQKLWRFAEKLAVKAGKISLKSFGKTSGIDWKKDNSPVTETDRKIEVYMRAKIRKAFPEHAIHGEEFGSDEYKDFTWVLDPIDGTRSFISGVPLYCSLVALLYKGQPMIGVIANPPSGEWVSACIGLGCRRDGGKTLGLTAPQKTLRICTSDFADLQRNSPSWLPSLLQVGATARTWGDAYGYLLLLTGRADIMIDPELSVWDIAPMYPLLEEAGGVLCDFKGKEAVLPEQAVACSRELFRQIF